eukprot:5890191-Pyramimonas_sp.AAC.1
MPEVCIRCEQAATETATTKRRRTLHPASTRIVCEHASMHHGLLDFAGIREHLNVLISTAV